jgi:hypothetical protein
MRWVRVLVAVAAIASASGVTWLYAQQAKPLPSMLPPEDHIEILQLYGYYARDVDSGTRRSAQWMYLPDGVWNNGGTIYAGPKMKQFYDDLQVRREAGMRHFSTNPVVVPTAEGARGSIYMMQIERKTKDGPVELTLFGKYEDRLVKTPKGWRFKERIWRSDTFRGDTEKIQPSPFAPVS